MSLPTCREIRNQLFMVVGLAMITLAVSTVVMRSRPSADSVAQAEEIQINSSGDPNWDGVNLTRGAPSPEDEIRTARSNMLREFEAR